MSAPSEIMTLLFKEAGFICNASRSLKSPTMLERAQGGFQVAAGATVGASQMLELLAVGGNVAQEATGIAGKALGMVPSAMKFWNQHLRDDLGQSLGLPKVDQSTFYKNLNQKQQPTTQNLLFNFHSMLQRLGPSQAETLHKVVLGDMSFSRRPPGVIGLKQTGEALRDLPPDKRAELVELFNQACIRSLESSSTKQSASSFYLISALIEVVRPSILSELKQRYLSAHKITPETQRLLEAANFPNNLRHAYLWKPEFLAICDPMKLQLEAQRIKSEIIQENGNRNLFTDAEIEQINEEMRDYIGQEPAVYSHVEKQKYDDLAKSKIFARMEPFSVLADSAVKYAHFIGEMRRNEENPDPHAATDLKFHRILEFLNTCDPNSSLAKEVDTILKSPEMSGALNHALNQCYQKSLQHVYEGLTPSQAEGEDLSQLPEVAGISSLPENPDGPLKRADALKFYNDHLNHPDKMGQVMVEFNKELTNFNNPAPQPTQAVSMAKIAILMGMLDPQKDIKEVEAYKNILIEMRASLQRKISEMPNNRALSEAFEFAQRVLDEMTIASFVSRGQRLEHDDKTKGKASTFTSFMSKAASTVGIIAPPSAVVTGPVAAAFGGLSALINALKYTPDSANVRELSSILLNSKEHSDSCYEEAMEKLNVTIGVIKCHQLKIKSILASHPLTENPEALRCIETILEASKAGLTCLEVAKNHLELNIGEFKPEDSQPEQIVQRAIAYEAAIKSVLSDAVQTHEGISTAIDTEMRKLEELIKPKYDDSPALMHV